MIEKPEDREFSGFGEDSRKQTQIQYGGSAVVEGFGFQIKTLDLHIGPESVCERDQGAGTRLCNPARNS